MSAIPLRRIEGKYEILEKIREGGMGAIYKVRHRLLEEVRVVKLMRPQLAQDDELKARFVREARFAIKLRHPNIAQLYDFTVDDDDATAFIVMEFIDGLNLEEMLALHGPPPVGFALEIARQSLRALGYLHLRGFVHRDISLDNLMLTADADGQPLVKLIDLGIAKGLDAGGDNHLTQTGMFIGKLRYSPPEQFRGEAGATIDGRADIYSFGVVLYELLTGRFPIQGNDPSSLIAGHLFRPPLDFAETDPAGRVPQGLREAVLKALAKEAEDRFPSAEELSRSLAAFRVAGDVCDDDLRRLLTRPFIPAGGGTPPRPAGSTQGRLDQNFELASTPHPVPLLALTTPTLQQKVDLDDTEAIEDDTQAIDVEEEERRKAEELAASVAEIEAALEKREYRGAESLLYAAEATFGGQGVFPPLYERIAESRRRDMVERGAAHLATARRLAAEGSFADARAEVLKARRLDAESREAADLLAEIDAAVRKTLPEQIEERLSQLDLDGAEELLARTPAADGDETLDALRERLDDLRRIQRREQALAAVIARIEAHLDSGELDAAGDLLDRAVIRFQAAEALREYWERLEQMRRAPRADEEGRRGR